MRHIVGPDRTGAAAAVVDDDGAELRLDPLRPDAADDVVHAGRNRRDDEPHGAERIKVLGPRRNRYAHRRREQTDDQHVRWFHHTPRVSVGGAPRAMVRMLEHIAVKWNQCERVVVVAAYSDPAIPACCTTLPQRTVSDLTKSCSPSTDRFSKGSMPSLRISVSISGSARMSMSSPWSFATMSRGVLPGATSMCQPGNAPNAGRPASAIGGMSGNAGTRVLVVTPRGRTLPARNIPTAGAKSQNISGICPATTSFKAGALPL